VSQCRSFRGAGGTEAQLQLQLQLMG